MKPAMKTTTGSIDRSGWGEGEWDNEPEDRIEWTENGLQLMIARGPNGAWCGYVDIPQGHDLHSDGLYWVSVHGDITLKVMLKSGARRVGFDCAHDCDVSPGYVSECTQGYAQYRTRDFAMRETRRLAAQIAKGKGSDED